MAGEKLREIDRELVRLLSRRIVCLAESGPAGSERDAEELTEFLREERVPGFLWRAVSEGCAAALATVEKRPTDARPRRAAIVQRCQVFIACTWLKVSETGNPPSRIERAKFALCAS